MSQAFRNLHQVRSLLGDVLRTDADLEAFCLDFFPQVKLRFTSAMDRTAKVTLLLEIESDLDGIVSKLRAYAPRHSAWSSLPRDFISPGSDIQTTSLPRRNPMFVGREQTLDDLHVMLQRRRGVALVALGGIGKSSLALEYAHRRVKDYALIFWLSASDSGALSLGFSDLYSYLIATDRTDDRRLSAREPDARRLYALNWLSLNPDWLLILDNADNPELLKSSIPDFQHGYLLCTTRAPDPGVLGLSPFGLTEFSGAEGLIFLSQRHRTPQSLAEESAAQELCRELGGLPLALEQAGAYLAENKTPFQAYLAAYRKRRAKLFPAGAFGEERTSVATVWSLAFELVEHASTASADLLRTSAFWSPDMIPERILEVGAQHLGEAIRAAFDPDDPLALDKLLRPLLRHSLIQRRDSGYRLHRLVQDVMRLRLGDSERIFAERAVRALAAAFPCAEFVNWRICHALMPCVEEMLLHIERLDLAFIEAADLLNEAGEYLWKFGHLDSVEPFCRRALVIRKKVLGLDHCNTATSLNNLAVVLRDQEKLLDAEPLCRQALAIRMRVLGSDHPDTATSLNTLGLILRRMQRLNEAEPLFRDALAIRERMPGGPDHRETARSLNSLARLLLDQQRWAEAELLCQRALVIYEKQDLTHPDNAFALTRLAEVLHAQGKHAEAEPLSRQALVIYEQALGPNHPRTELARREILGYA